MANKFIYVLPVHVLLLIYIQNTGIKREKIRFSAKTHALFC